jgi:hypothetical protein
VDKTISAHCLQRGTLHWGQRLVAIVGRGMSLTVVYKLLPGLPRPRRQTELETSTPTRRCLPRQESTLIALLNLALVETLFRLLRLRLRLLLLAVRRSEPTGVIRQHHQNRPNGQTRVLGPDNLQECLPLMPPLQMEEVLRGSVAAQILDDNWQALIPRSNQICPKRLATIALITVLAEIKVDKP